MVNIWTQEGREEKTPYRQSDKPNILRIHRQNERMSEFFQNKEPTGRIPNQWQFALSVMLVTSVR